MSLSDMDPDTVRHLTENELANSIAAALDTALPYPLQQVKQGRTILGYVEMTFEVNDPAVVQLAQRTRVEISVRVVM